MKKVFSYISALSLALAFNACESNLDTVTYDASLAKPAVFTALDASYELDAQKSEEVVFTLKWTEPDMGYQAAVTNNVELDIAGNDFAQKRVVASVGKGGEYALTHNDLNNLLLGLLEDAGMGVDPVDVELRISSSISEAVKPVYSNTISTNITPFVGEREYPKIWIVGDYCGWNHGNSQFIYSANEDDSYAGMVYFDGKAQNGWKLTPQGQWGAEWAALKDAIEPEATTATLVTSGGGNIEAYSHTSYYFEFDKSTAVLKVSKAHDSWGVVGVHNAWGNTPDVKMTLGTEVKFGTTQYFLEATLDLKANEGWKIRPDGTWSDDVGPGAVDTTVEGKDGNFIVPEDGNYTIKWYFNKVKQQLVVTKN
ncbi:SusE domain-containing protein [uncultured Bacteroides sp.]|uniref:SusE domain-containing protein n=1 Tax=uncultured Bacteroides sp. TaxID=162156 RepID=UPI0025E5AC71|nr:SusE domain-containing protein [uncultured Bacteroides sp.]